MFMFTQTVCRGDSEVSTKEVKGETIREAIETLLNEGLEEAREYTRANFPNEEDTTTLDDIGTIEEGEEAKEWDCRVWTISKYFVEGLEVPYGINVGEEETRVIAKTTRELAMVLGTLVIKGELNIFALD